MDNELQNEQPINQDEVKYEVGMPYHIVLELKADRLQKENGAPLSENYLRELQERIDEIRTKGGRVSGVLTGDVYDAEASVNTTVNILQVVGDEKPPKIQVVLPDFESRKKLEIVGNAGSGDSLASAVLIGIAPPSRVDTRKLINTLRKDEWRKQALNFLDNQDSMLVGVVEGRAMDQKTGVIEIRRFLLLE